MELNDLVGKTNTNHLNSSGDCKRWLEEEEIRMVREDLPWTGGEEERSNPCRGTVHAKAHEEDGAGEEYTDQVAWAETIYGER